MSAALNQTTLLPISVMCTVQTLEVQLRLSGERINEGISQLGTCNQKKISPFGLSFPPLVLRAGLHFQATAHICYDAALNNFARLSMSAVLASPITK